MTNLSPAVRLKVKLKGGEIFVWCVRSLLKTLVLITAYEDEGGSKLKKCVLCGGKIREEKRSYDLRIGDDVYRIKEVPMEVCSKCGEEYLTPETSRKIDRVKEKIRKNKIKTVQTGSTYETV